MTEEKTKPKGRPDSQEQQIQEKTKLKGREDQNEEETKPEDTRETQEKPRHKRRPDEREDQREQRREDWREDQVQGRTRPKRRADSREEQTEEHTGPKRNLEQRRIRAKSRGESSVDLGEFTRFFPLISNMAAIVLSCKSIFSRKNMPSWRKCRPSLRLNKQLRSFLSPQKQNGGNCSFLQEHFPSTKKSQLAILSLPLRSKGQMRRVIKGVCDRPYPPYWQNGENCSFFQKHLFPQKICPVSNTVVPTQVQAVNAPRCQGDIKEISDRFSLLMKKMVKTMSTRR